MKKRRLFNLAALLTAALTALALPTLAQSSTSYQVSGNSVNMPGAFGAKALEPLASGTGLIKVVVMLR